MGEAQSLGRNDSDTLANRRTSSRYDPSAVILIKCIGLRDGSRLKLVIRDGPACHRLISSYALSDIPKYDPL